MSNNWNDGYMLKVIDENEIGFIKDFYKKCCCPMDMNIYKLWYMSNIEITEDALYSASITAKPIYSIYKFSGFDNFYIIANKKYFVRCMEIQIAKHLKSRGVTADICINKEINNIFHDALIQKVFDIYILLNQIFNFKDIQIYIFKIYCDILL